MRIAGWNCRGLGNGPAVRGLLDIQKREDPDILFLSETKSDEKRMKHFKWILEMHNVVVKESDGKSGGLTMFWKKDIKVELHNYSKYHIYVEVVEEDGFRWRLTGIYGEPSTDKKENTWKLLRDLNLQLSRPWLCFGDFNEILFSHEKRGDQPRAQVHMDNFRKTLEECDLRDLGYRGDKYTWRNHSLSATHYIKERLDRAVASPGWITRFPHFSVLNGDPRHSDHRPIIIDIFEKRRFEVFAGAQNFRFEAKWLIEDDCERVIRNAWQEAQQNGQTDIMSGLKKVASELKEWDRNVLGDMKKRLKKAKDDLEATRRRDISPDQVAKEAYLREKVSKLENQQDLYWKQRAHVNWLRSGDRNTSYFHAYASERKKRNTIYRLKKENGNWVEEEQQMKEHVGEYFTNLFTSTASSDTNIVTRHVQARVDREMNELLSAPFTREEIKAALDSIGDLKAPGPDGMPAVFYKRFWHVVGDKVTQEVLNVLNGGGIPDGWNDTMVVLIPKKSKPESLKDLRPISLCNVIYKNKRSGAEGYAAVKLLT